MKYLITGGAGFIGSAVIRHIINNTESHVLNLDKLTYAGNLNSLDSVSNNPRYKFIKGDITDQHLVSKIFSQFQPDVIMHLAAESHVDRSIENPSDFITTNIVGTSTLLEVARSYWCNLPENKKSQFRFHHISTDEVYGSLSEKGFFTENNPYDPSSPYSASKASSDHFVRAYGETYGMPYVISNCSNNYGANQFPEKLIPLFINNIINKKNLPVYGDGKYTRDWLYVVDHAIAIDLVFHKGKNRETYNIGGFNEWQNLDLIKLLCTQMDQKLGRQNGESKKLIKYVKDRPGHDLRYAIDASKIKKELGWEPSVTFEQGLSKTIDWYLNNSVWMERVVSGAYEDYYNKQYK